MSIHDDSYEKEDSDVLENDPLDSFYDRLQSREENYDVMGESYNGDACDIFELCDLDSDTPLKYLKSKRDILTWMVGQLATSPSARKMLHEAEIEGWAVAIEPLDGQDFHIDVPENLIILDDQGLTTDALAKSEYFKNALMVSFIRALRDVWQEKRHGAFETEYGPEQVLMLERVRAADLDVLATLVGWEIRAEGEGSLWRHLIGATEGDIAMRFSGYLERDPSAQFNGKALAAAFTQWFRNEERVNSCDHETLNYLDNVIEYSDEEYVLATKNALGTIGIEMLSCLPDRTAYLQGMGKEILSNPLYAGLCDEINQAHFAQIMYDLKVVRVQDVPFRDAYLAEMIFPNGEFTPDGDETIH